MRIERKYTRVGDFRFHSVHAGAGDPVLLLHGLAGSHRWWRYTLPTLAASFRVHVPELIGFGASRPVMVQPDILRMAGLLVDWLEALEVERAHVVGHSMGGQLSIHIAARWPERVTRLVLASAAGIPRTRSVPELARFLSELIPPRAWGRPTFLPTIARDALRAGPLVVLRAARYLLADDVRPLLPAIAAPTLVIWGRLDPLTPLANGWVIADRIPGARLAVLPDAAHNPMIDRPAKFNEIVRSFLAEGDARS